MARSTKSSARPLNTAFTIQSMEPLAISAVMAGGMGSNGSAHYSVADRARRSAERRNKFNRRQSELRFRTFEETLQPFCDPGSACKDMICFPVMSLVGRLCCKSRFAEGVRNSEGRGCGFRVE